MKHVGPCLLMYLSVCATAMGARYYVSPQGAAQPDGSREKPFALAQLRAKVRLKGGDEVVFLDGVYRPADVMKRRRRPGKQEAVLNTFGEDASERARVLFRAENRHRAVLEAGTPVTKWTRVPGADAQWECTLPFAPLGMIVDEEPLFGPNWHHNADPAKMRRGDFIVRKRDDGRVTVRVWPWYETAPKKVVATYFDCAVLFGAPFTTVQGFVIRHGSNGAGLGAPHSTVRDCIIRDIAGQGIAGGARFSVIEDCVIYNVGIPGRDHGIYTSGKSEDVTLRRNIWWRIGAGAIHIYSGGEGVDRPARIHVEYNLIGPDKGYLARRKTCGLYIYGGSRWCGYNRIVRNIVFGGHDRAFSMKGCHFNLIAHNVFLDCDDAPLQVWGGLGHVIANNIVEAPAGNFLIEGGDAMGLSLPQYRNNLLLAGKGKDVRLPAGSRLKANGNRVVAEDPFVDRARFDFRLKAGSAAVDLGMKLPFITANRKGKAPDAGALELGEAMFGEEGKFPTIPAWLLEEWPLSYRESRRYKVDRR